VSDELRLTRRQLVGAGAAAAAAAGTLSPARALAQLTRPSLPAPGRSGIDHIVVVMMENRSFDHLLGWLRGANAKQAGLTYVDAAGNAHQTHPLAPDFQGCAFADPDHSYDGARVEFNNGACDGWLRAGKNDLYSIGYYGKADLPFLGQAAPRWTVCDNYFSAILAPTFPNRFYLHAGVTDRIANEYRVTTLPTIWDRLAEKRLNGRYYAGNTSFLLLWNQKYNSITSKHARFFADCRTGKLPHVAYVDPSYTLTDVGPGSGNTGFDDHPHADIRAGEWFLSRIYDAVTKSPAWPRTLLVVTFDEWGGFFDHVPPPAGPDVDPRYEQRGFRVPTVLISPYARRAAVDHRVYDHTSILKLIEWRFGLRPLSARDAAAENLASALDFSKRRLAAPKITVPRVDIGAAC
jgi:phospholipase C